MTKPNLKKPNLKKEKLRKELRDRRRELSGAADQTVPAALSTNFLQALPNIFRNTVVAGYYPMGSEINPLALLETLEKSGVEIALPVVVEQNTPLEFRAYKFGDKLKKGQIGAKEPLKKAKAVVPDIVLVPLLGFDEAGNRIGQGLGYYDRTLCALRKKKDILAVGLAFEGQKQKALPFEQHDQDLDAVVTEAGCWLFRSGKAAT